MAQTSGRGPLSFMSEQHLRTETEVGHEDASQESSEHVYLKQDRLSLSPASCHYINQDSSCIRPVNQCLDGVLPVINGTVR